MSRRLIAIIAWFAAGCSGEPNASRLPYATAMDTVGDTVVARTTGEVPDSLVRRLVVEWQAAENPDSVPMGDIAGMVVGQDGRIYIWDYVTPALWMLNADGNGLRRVGRAGGGPGEYRQVAGLAILSDGRLLLWDIGNARLNIYQPSGEFITSRIIPAAMCCPYNPIAIDTLGRAWLEAVVLSDKQAGPPRLGGDNTAFLRVDTAGLVIDTLLSPPLPGDDPMLVATQEIANGVNMRAQVMPYGTRTVRAASPGGFIITGQGRPYVIHSQLQGRPLRIERSMTPVAISSVERDQIKAHHEYLLRQVQPDWSWTGSGLPTEKPAFSDLAVGDDRRIWAALSVASESYDPDVPERSEERNAPSIHFRPRESRWDVFEPDGRYLGQVLASRLFEAHVMRGDTVWGVLRDDDDVPAVVKMRITPGL